MALQRFDVEFTKDGSVFSPAQVEALLAGVGGVAGVSDLFVLSHGWNNDMAEARELYDELVGNLEAELALATAGPVGGPLDGLAGRSFVVAQLFWPSKKFADHELIAGGGSASAEAASAAEDPELERLLDGLAQEPARLGGAETAPGRKNLAERAKALLPALEGDAEAREEFLSILRRLLDDGAASEDDGSKEFFSAASEELFDSAGPPVLPVPTADAGGAAAVGNGGAAGLGDLLNGAKAAARRLANFATYYQMKSRAGTVGTAGLAPVLRRLRQAKPQLRLHLVGHSFGGRLVTAAAHALPDNSAAVTISLLQAAFSHNGLSGNFGGGSPGDFRDILAKHRASGPIVITHTRNDRAVGVAYPLASRIAHQNASFLVGGPDDPYGGMGRNGAQRTAEAVGNDKTLGKRGKTYGFAQDRVYNLLSDDVISGHSDVRGPEVAFAILSAASAV